MTRVLIARFGVVVLVLIGLATLRAHAWSGDQDTPQATSLLPLLQKHKVEDIVTRYAAKVWVGRIPTSPNQGQIEWFNHNAIYRDSNNNGIMDPRDEGFFEPASTVKTAVAASTLAQLRGMGLPSDKANRLAEMMVISDNTATNELIAELGFKAINENVRSRSIADFVLSRFMMQPAAPAFLGCYEVEGVAGNCASAQALSSIMLRFVRPELFEPGERFEIDDEHRSWLLQKMASTPRESGFEGHGDEECRLLQRTYTAMKNIKSIDKVFVKCGVSPKNNHWTELSYVKTLARYDLVVVLSVNGKGRQDDSLYSAMNAIAKPIVAELLPSASKSESGSP